MAKQHRCSNEITALICGRLAEGESLRKICKDDDMPCMRTVYSWLTDNPDFLRRYELARADQADTFADEIIDIADDGTNDYMESLDDAGNVGYRTNGENIARSRLRVDARKWVASKLKPKKYGDKTDLNLGGQQDNPLTAVARVIVDPKDTDS